MTHKQSIGEIFSFSGKTVIVTGGAMGIGFGIAERFFEAGANVVIADIDEAEGRKKAAALGDRALFVKTDVSDETSVKNLVAETTKRFGGLDVLVNDAGIYPTIPVMNMDVAVWDKIQNINLRGTFLTNREAAKAMKPGGSIVNIGSIDSLHPSSMGLAAYDASKHGVWGFTKNFVIEAAAMKIRVNVLAPGGIATEGTAKIAEQAKKAGIDMEAMMKTFAAKIPMKHMGEPDDIAMPTLFLASDAARYITGEILVVDGGALLS